MLKTLSMDATGQGYSPIIKTRVTFFFSTCNTDRGGMNESRGYYQKVLEHG